MEDDGHALRDPPPEKMRGKRIGWLNFGVAVPYEPEVISVCKAALKRFESLDCEIGEATPDVDPERAWQAFMRLRAWQQFPQLAPFVHDSSARAMRQSRASRCAPTTSG